MRSRLVLMIVLVACLFAIAVLPAAAAPLPQVSVTHYILIDATNPQPTVVFSTVPGVQVTRTPAGASFEVTFTRNFRYLVGTAYGVCTGPAWDCPQYVNLKYVLRDASNPRKWLLVVNYDKSMISLMVKP